MRKAFLLTVGIFGFLYGIAFGPVFGAERKPADQKAFNALMDRLYPSGKGPASNNRARGFYKGGGGEWKRR